MGKAWIGCRVPIEDMEQLVEAIDLLFRGVLNRSTKYRVEAMYGGP